MDKIRHKAWNAVHKKDSITQQNLICIMADLTTYLQNNELDSNGVLTYIDDVKTLMDIIKAQY